MVEFPAPKVEDKNRPSEEVEEIKKQVRQAIKILEEDKQVAAFNLLKRYCRIGRNEDVAN
jgi:hypothetical protein